jgi:two-component sensor histidine kinase
MRQLADKQIRMIEVLTHVVGWGLMFVLPVYYANRGNNESVTLVEYMRHSGVPFFLCVVFYVNYLLLIPKLLFRRKVKEFLMVNVVLVIAATGGLYFWQSAVFSMTSETPPPPPVGPERGPRHGSHYPMPPLLFCMRDTVSMIIVIVLATAAKLIGRWNQIETERREAEQRRTEAELKNLRNQLNPHFLLNTLNNIYALIAFDADKAQTAVQELSKLLRHVLYDNQQPYVSLGKEMDFIRNYIELMRIRLSPHVTVKTQIDIDPESQTPIAPLIFISLIENAFKHGISPTDESKILISFSENRKEVRCLITNSYHPKSSADKSGSGIGLEQVRQRLELMYPGRFDWQHGVNNDGTSYVSKLVINVSEDAK